MSSSRNSSLTNNQSPSIFSTITPSMSPSITPSISVNESPSLLESIGNGVTDATNSVINTTSNAINTVNPFKSKEPTLIESTVDALSNTTNSIVDTTSNVIDTINPFKSKEPTLLENVENTVYNTASAVKDTFAPKTTPPLSNTPITPPDNIIYKVFRIILMIILICILALNAILFLNERTDIFTKYLGIPILKTTSTAKGTVNKANEGGKFVLDVIKDSINDLFTLPEMAIKQFINGNNNTGKYCYVGKDQDKRVCVEIDDKDVCESNKIFPTMDVCINPNLK